MRRHEVTHPYIIELRIDPALFHDFQRLTQDSREVILITYDDSDPDLWTLHVACASEAVAERMEEGWA